MTMRSGCGIGGAAISMASAYSVRQNHGSQLLPGREVIAAHGEAAAVGAVFVDDKPHDEDDEEQGAVKDPAWLDNAVAAHADRLGRAQGSEHGYQIPAHRYVFPKPDGAEEAYEAVVDGGVA